MISAYKDYYQILGLSPSASSDEIKRAYRRLALKYHPDHNPKRRSAEERFKLLQQAYETLSDPEKRKQYDQTLPDVDSENAALDWRLSSLAPYVLPFLIGSVIGALLGFRALVESYTPALDSPVWGFVFIGGGAVLGGVAACIYYARKSFN